MTKKNFMVVEDLVLNGLEQTLERKIPLRDRRWKVAEESADYDVNEQSSNESCPIEEYPNLNEEH